MEELDDIRASARRQEDLLSLYRHQLRQCEDLLMDVRAVWRDRAAQRTWARNVEPRLADASGGEEQLARQAQHFATALTRAQTASESVAAALSASQSAAEHVEQANDDVRRADQLVAAAVSDAASAESAAAAAMAEL